MDSHDWESAMSFEEYVISLFRARAFHTPEFQILLKIYGREKLEAIWKAMCHKLK